MNNLGRQHLSHKYKIPFSFAPCNPEQYGINLDLVFEETSKAIDEGHDEDCIVDICNYLGILIYPMHRDIIKYKIIS